MTATPTPTTVGLSISDTTLEELCDWIAGGIFDRLKVLADSPWLTVEQAADYLGWSKHRIYKCHDLPSHKHGNRLMFNRNELDDYLRGL